MFIVFTITDALTNCVSTVITEELFAPSIVLIDALVPTNALCEGDANGTITVNLAATILGTNDEPIYTYEITVGPIVVAPQNSNLFTGLPAGTYTVLVTSVKRMYGYPKYNYRRIASCFCVSHSRYFCVYT